MTRAERQGTTMKAFDVYFLGKLLDRVYYCAGCDPEYVRISLINHDGFPTSIIVLRA
jgi:hypothetical protein